MGEIRVGTWGEFEEKAWGKIEGMGASAGGRRRFTDRVLFRGQGDARWGLTTTLQRATGQNEEAVDNYQMQMHAVRDSVASVQGQDWDTEGVLPLPGFVVKGIEFMVYLRQNGFPSPLLDWTSSPYIAA
jgi:hypothetical protein